MAGPSRTCCVSEYCTGVLHNQKPWDIHSLRPISIPFTKNAEEPVFWVHLSRSGSTPVIRFRKCARQSWFGTLSQGEGHGLQGVGRCLVLK